MPRSPAQPVRLFVALYPPIKVAARMIESLGMLNLPPHRVAPAGQVHMTLQFIGDTEQAAVDSVIESAQRSASGVGSFTLTTLRLVALPERAPARLIAIETDSPPPLLELHRRLALRLARTPRADPSDRFLPHLTLCRFRAPTPFATPRVDLHVPAFAPDRIALMRSVLLPGGAEHREVAKIPLGGRDSSDTPREQAPGMRGD